MSLYWALCLFDSGLTTTPLINLEGRKVNVDQLSEASQILQKEGILLYHCKDLLLCPHFFLPLHFTVETAKCKVVKVIAILDRHEGGSDMLKEKGYDFTAILNIYPSKEQ